MSERDRVGVDDRAANPRTTALEVSQRKSKPSVIVAQSTRRAWLRAFALLARFAGPGVVSGLVYRGNAGSRTWQDATLLTLRRAEAQL
jgi:hypothetical protein